MPHITVAHIANAVSVWLGRDRCGVSYHRLTRMVLDDRAIPRQGRAHVPAAAVYEIFEHAKAAFSRVLDPARHRYGVTVSRIEDRMSTPVDDTLAWERVTRMSEATCGIRSRISLRSSGLRLLLENGRDVRAGQ